MKIPNYVKSGNIKEVARLINQGVDINLIDKDSGQTPLMIAVSNPDVSIDMVCFLVENGADINAVESQFQDTVLGFAVKAGNLDKIQFLLDAGTDINYRTPNGNDVVVFDGKGNFQIYGYPSDVFPPTDFHSATLAENYIYIIGSLGYQSARIPNQTPVYRLDCDTFQIEKVKTTGDKPGWISRHKAKYQSPSQIYITGGKLSTREDYIENSTDYILDLNTFEWGRVNL
ncbi:ankyrin repeat domain-containing protein [Rivularia sp. UHCC 0363]|uniref:ankyrin repeat domain-containing protein n=1 Tax=Rivularia sp. UHCC 0363 TaxID=3110244 RepID=UPI002B21AB9E|nr:ankyrin repeat domain-containing protein [Rivularia sp. UHCC 0363]MEA5593236.1 ankyrin repeat domain-containing protein [Rivularia sp. UHCC 0363]